MTTSGRTGLRRSGDQRRVVGTPQSRRSQSTEPVMQSTMTELSKRYVKVCLTSVQPLGCLSMSPQVMTMRIGELSRRVG